MARIKAEIADTPAKQATGLMHRKKLPCNAGMLFDFKSERPLSFWMKNTHIPLQIAFIGSNGRIGQIESMKPFSPRSIYSKGSYRYALEVNDGWFDRNGIQVGAQAAVPFPPPGQDPGSMPQPQIQTGPGPDLVIEVSAKEVLRQCISTPIPIIVDYTDDDGNNYLIEFDGTSYTFVEDASGDLEGRFQGWGITPGGPGYKSPLIDGINKITDLAGSPIENPQQVEAVFQGRPLTEQEQDSIAGKMGIPAEQEDETEGDNADIQS